MEVFQRWHTGTAGWQLPEELKSYRRSATQLEQYATYFNAVEINSTFYRPHLSKTFERWAATVPNGFRFAVKMHNGVTHVDRLKDIGPVQQFLDMVGMLGDRLGPVLVQLPPSLVWSSGSEEFLNALREAYAGDVVLEARHPSWAKADVLRVLLRARISGVAADPPLIMDELMPSGYAQLTYFRLHGSPRVYWSSYDDAFLIRFAAQLMQLLKAGRTVWTIFDNTAAGAAAMDALRLRRIVEGIIEGNVPSKSGQALGPKR